MLSDGAVPGIGDGFARFVAVPAINEQIQIGVEKEIREAKTNPYHSHPPPRDRIAATEKLPAGFIPEDTNPARSLLDQADALELQYLEKMNPDLKPGTLKCLSWDEVGTRVTIPAWKRFTAEYSAALEGVTAESLPEQVPRLRQIGAGIRDPKAMLLDAQQRTNRAGYLFGAGLGLALIDQGRTLHSGPGIFHLQQGREELNPFSVMEQLMSGKLTAQDWIARCNALGIGQLIDRCCSGATGRPARSHGCVLGSFELRADICNLRAVRVHSFSQADLCGLIGHAFHHRTTVHTKRCSAAWARAGNAVRLR